VARLPIVGGDNGSWGQILNDFLSQEHNPDGTLKRIGQANGIATLNSSGQLSAAQIPPAIDLTNRVVQVNKNQDNTWPVRPSAERVMWVGVGNPDPPYTTAGDVWIDTSA